VNDIFGFASRALIHAADEKDIPLSKHLATALIHRMTQNQFVKLKDLKSKKDRATAERKDSSKYELKIFEILAEVGQSLLEDASIIDPAYPKAKRFPDEGKAIQKEIRNLMKQLPQTSKASR
jgi:hypothetical protein